MPSDDLSATLAQLEAAVSAVGGQGAASSASGLIDLPEELLVVVLSHASDDDYSMLTLPLSCRAVRRAFGAPLLTACRLSSRLRQVADALPPGQPDVESFSWLVGHSWSALLDAQAFLAEDGAGDAGRRASAFAVAPGGASSLRALARWAATLEAPVRPPSSAEALFMESEKQRQAALHARSHSLLRKTTAGDDRRVLRQEAERQAKRQLDATVRRLWMQMGAQQRGGWQQAASKALEGWRRERDAAATTAELAASLCERLDSLRLAGATDGRPIDD